MTTREDLAVAYLKLSPYKAASLLERLPPQMTASLLEQAGPETAAPVLTAMQGGYAADCILVMERKFQKDVIARLSHLRCATILRFLPEKEREEIMSRLSMRQAGIIRSLHTFPAHLVGAWMDPDIPVARPDLSIKEARKLFTDVSRTGKQFLYIVNERHQLMACISAVTLLTAPDESSNLSSLASPPPPALSANMDVGVAERHDEWVSRLELPVVNRNDELTGIISRAALIDAQRKLKARNETSHISLESGIDELAGLYRSGLDAAWKTWRSLFQGSSRF